jgi:hypothetical protein
MWEQLESLAQEIKEAWCTAPNREGLGGIVAALRRVQGALRSWGKRNFGSVTNELEELRAKLEEMKSDLTVENKEVRKITDKMDDS